MVYINTDGDHNQGNVKPWFGRSAMQTHFSRPLRRRRCSVGRHDNSAAAEPTVAF
jgi:hypothetical protein